MTSTETRPDPAVMRVTVTPGDVDVTEGVRTLYDLVISSMNWGSGFLSIEDVEGVIRVAQTCGFLVPARLPASSRSTPKRSRRWAYADIPPPPRRCSGVPRAGSAVWNAARQSHISATRSRTVGCIR
jgi:hypothetical protein